VGCRPSGGEIYFPPCYNGNPLVNAMSVGDRAADAVASARAPGVGNPVLYVGSATGARRHPRGDVRERRADRGVEAKRPNVQVGDPFTEKLLIEATLEALPTGTSSASRTWARRA
jgi:phosphoribosylformylglycinamidine synthase